MTMARPTTYFFVVLTSSLYFYQGLLYGFQVCYLPLFFKSHGSSTAQSGFIRLLAFPWLLKGLWAPLVDKTLDTTTWINSSFIGTASCLLICVLQGAETVSVAFTILLVILNIFSATAELGLSRFVILFLRENEIWRGSLIQTIGYKSGALIGGGFLIWIQAYFDLDSRVVISIPTGLNILLCFALLYLYKKGYLSDLFAKRKDSIPQTSVDQEITENEHQSCICFNELLHWFSSTVVSMTRTPGTVWVMACVCAYKLGGQGGLFAFQMYLVETGINVGIVGLLVGVVGQLLSIAAAATAGLLIRAQRVSDVGLLQTCSIISSAAVIMQLIILFRILDDDLLVVYASVTVIVIQLSLGFMTTAVFTLMMTCSKMNPDDACASHYALLVTIETGSKLLYIYLTGLQVEYFGYIQTYYVLLFSSFLFVVIMLVFPRNLFEKQREKTQLSNCNQD